MRSTSMLMLLWMTALLKAVPMRPYIIQTILETRFRLPQLVMHLLLLMGSNRYLLQVPASTVLM